MSAATFALFSPAIGYDFINFDDTKYVYENVHVAQGFSRENLIYAFRTIDGDSWMPATWLSYFLDTALHGTKPAGYHLTNLLLHAASAGLLFLALYQMTQRRWQAAVVAALFAVHPQRLESVAWVSERKDVLSVFFWMLGLLAYARYAKQPGWSRMLGVAICLLVGLMAKPIVVSFPLVLLLLDFWPLRRFGSSAAEFCTRAWPLLREKLPLFALCTVVMGLTLWSQRAQGTIVPIHFPWYLVLCRVLENVWFYEQSFFVPIGLAIVYRTEPLAYLHVALVGLTMGMISLLAWWQARRQPWLTVGWFWFLGTLAPVAGLIRIGEITVADRYSYLPSVGLALAVVFSAMAAMQRWPSLRAWLTGGLAGWVLCCSLATSADLPCWRNTFTIFENAYLHGAHFIACDQLASSLYTRQDFQASLAVCNRGLAENPELVSLYNTRASDYLMLGDLNRAMADYDRAIQLNPDYSPPYYGRAMAHLQRKQYAEAQADVKAYVQHHGQLDVSALKIPPQ